ncbi:RNA polymerase sigma-54 factor [Virgibacillus natechei]|uniref:RNA polymerase sigma-54 factor n=1 Tax=Virgibacillus natechei TaxID=1216297 RepID=A0ABS4IES3_9BACI|nr:RNA polymerase factor sigma-54 [Virgibacillus natechei]MBP1969437.1 RNA polymerase sigma-54 factor [Virgibacillus natechei]UZD11852.1 RNA polymerase factor sigma-54 [Virgibacillus natechei]
MKPRLVQEQTLQWKMNQSLLQSIHILQFDSVELIDYIKEVSKENPLIEEVNYDYDFAQYKSSSSNDVSIGEINQAELTMYDHLKNQLYTLDMTDEQEPIILFGIDSLDEDGYLTVDIDLWAKQCHTTEETVEQALVMIQSLEPAGIAARSLSECILIQLKKMNITQSFIEDLLKEHLNWIAEENYQTIAAHYATNEANIKEIIDCIKLCHPKPGKLLVTEKPEYIIPEASIYKAEGTWKVSFYKWNSPTIEINQSYKEFKDVGEETAAYLKEKYKQVDWLQQAIKYRSHTLEHVVKNIVEKQYMYFEHGAFMLQPLTLREIANDLDLHVSTVSRTINNKYVQTTQGVTPVKFFLQSGIKQLDGKQTASFVIKKLIGELMQHENKIKPLSDEQIKKKLDDEFDIKIARRTVMKYRKQLNIPSSTKRKQ